MSTPIPKFSNLNKNIKHVGNENFRSLRPLIVILGPTASGKSDIALKLAKKLNGEIISADSRQIYKEMNIGTAKMTQDKKLFKFLSLRTRVETRVKQSQVSAIDCFVASAPRNDKKTILTFRNNKKLKPIIIKNIPHHLLDIIKPDEKFSVAEYKELAVKIIRDIQNRGKIPILAGGTGLYISAVADNIEIPKVKPNLKLRKKLEKTSPAILLKQLKKLDPDTFNAIDKKNIRRIIRALEVTISTGIPFSNQRTKGAPLFDCLQIGLDAPREKLYKKIDQRVEKMFNPEYRRGINGERHMVSEVEPSRTINDDLITETKRLMKKYSWRLPSMSGIGYKETGMYLRDKITLERAKELIKFATHNYARRQMTWFGKNKKIKWFKTDNKNNFEKIVKMCKNFLKK